MSHDLLTVFRAHTDKVLSVSPGFLGTDGRFAVKIGGVGHHFSPLGSKKVYYIYPLSLALE